MGSSYLPIGGSHAVELTGGSVIYTFLAEEEDVYYLHMCADSDSCNELEYAECIDYKCEPCVTNEGCKTNLNEVLCDAGECTMDGIDINGTITTTTMEDICTEGAIKITFTTNVPE